MGNFRHPFIKARDEELLALYPSIPTCVLAEQFKMTEKAIRNKAKHYKVEKLPGCPRKAHWPGAPKVIIPAAEPPSTGSAESPTAQGVQGVVAVTGGRLITHKMRG